ncbi:MAG TPA: LuxR C-terminal-related transcriptional regulator [Thermoanaerobaculia bacterium]|nr:LuxR C-terminal-related transcriptional regulator [Thermoanaerobaculia bacterium]
MGTADVAVDAKDRIVSWSPAAEALFGHAASTALGARLQDLLDGRDLFGNRVCRDACWLREALGAGEAVRRYELDTRHAEGHRLRVVVDVQASAGRSHGWTYRFQPDRRANRRRAPTPPPVESRPPEPAFVLTQRELDALRLLARGAGTVEMAREMGITGTTVRNHVQHLLEKLGAHNRLQAVSVAHRYGLV